MSSPSPIQPGILVLAFYYPPENAIGGVRPARMAKYLSRLGHQVSVVAREVQGSNDLGVRTLPAIQLSRHSFGYRLAAIAGRVAQRLNPRSDRLDWLVPALSAAFRMMEARPAEVVVSTYPPLVTHLAALVLKRKYKMRWVADFRDPLYKNPSRSGRFMGWCDRIVERTIFARADLMVANTEEIAHIWREDHPEARDRIVVIPNGYDPEETIEPLAAGGCRRVISHVGAIYVGRDPGPLLASVKRLIDRRELDASELQVRLIGSLHQDSLQDPSLLQSLSGTGCLYCNDSHIPRSEADRETLSADLLLLLDSSSGVQVPGKLFEYVRIGRFIVAVTKRKSSVARILEKAGIPHYCIYPDLPEEEVDSAMLKILRGPLTRSQPSDWFLREFDSAAQSRRLSELIRA
jgi:glycosyltransferase involved in cell wall biosynthesis